MWLRNCAGGTLQPYLKSKEHSIMRNAVAIVVFVSTLLSLAAAAQESRSEISCKGRDFSLAELLATERNTAAPRAEVSWGRIDIT
jgi:hypothetical protein